MEIFFTHSFGREQWDLMKIIPIIKQSQSSTFTIMNVTSATHVTYDLNCNVTLEMVCILHINHLEYF